MLRSLTILSGAGTALFEKEWVKDFVRPAGSKWAGLIRTLEEFSAQCVGFSVSYMQFASVAVTVTKDPKTKLICTLFHDAEIRELAKYISTEILLGFRETFGTRDFTGTFVSASDYASFGMKLVDCISNAVRAIIVQLQSQRGIITTMLVYEDGKDPIVEGHVDDEISVVANFQALLTIANQTLSITSDKSRYMSLDMPRKILYVHQVGGANWLVTVCKKKLTKEEYYPHIDQAVRSLDKCTICTFTH